MGPLPGPASPPSCCLGSAPLPPPCRDGGVTYRLVPSGGPAAPAAPCCRRPWVPVVAGPGVPGGPPAGRARDGGSRAPGRGGQRARLLALSQHLLQQLPVRVLRRPARLRPPQAGAGQLRGGGRLAAPGLLALPAGGAAASAPPAGTIRGGAAAPLPPAAAAAHAAAAAPGRGVLAGPPNGVTRPAGIPEASSCRCLGASRLLLGQERLIPDPLSPLPASPLFALRDLRSEATNSSRGRSSSGSQ